MIGYKAEAQKQWNANPCGARDSLDGLEYGSVAWFDAIRHQRYEVTDRWIKRAFDFRMARGKKLLEIGHGVGTDLLEFCKGGAEVYGIDITEEHHRLARRNFELHGRSAVLKLCDAADIDFPSEYFDYVYSLGVLHHTPDTVRCVSEAYRVLKPGGRLILSLYHTFAAFHLLGAILYRGVFKRGLWTHGYRRLMSRVEYGADGVRVAPLVKTYRRGQLRHILADFSRTEFRVMHFTREHIPCVGRFVPRLLEGALEPHLGWYITAFATK